MNIRTRLNEVSKAVLPKLRKLAGFFLGQGSVQALNLLTGFLLLRWLSVEQYAIYALVAGFQGTVGILVEMGLGSSLTGLLAGRTDKATVGGYIRSAKRYRNIFFAVALPLMAVAFATLFLRQGWSWELGLGLFFALLVNTFFLSWTQYYSLPFLIRHDMSGLYRLQTIFGALRLLVCWLLQIGGVIGALVVVWFTALSTTVMGWAYRKQATPLINEPKQTDPGKNREVLNFIRPLVPATLFFAFQGQIGVFLISWFGNVDSIAEVGALGRLSQIFVMLGALNAVIIAPYIARCSQDLLPKKYLKILASGILLSIFVTFLGFFSPNSLIWILGENYFNLKPELGWLLLSSSITYLTNVMFTMHSARKWIFIWGSMAYVFSTIVVQVGMLCFMDLSTTRSVVIFGLVSAAASFLVQAFWGMFGFLLKKSEHARET